MLARRLVFFFALVVSLSLFNNCDNNFTVVQLKNNSLQQSTGDVCMDQLRVVYSQTYYPFMKTTCNQCHADKHGSTILQTSFAAFMSYGSTLIDHQSTTAHGGNSLGPQMQPQIDAFKPTWNQANDSYLTCKVQQANNNPGGGTSVLDVALVGKVVPNLMSTTANVNTYVPLSFNTATEVMVNSQMNVIKGTLRVEVKILPNGTIAAGLLFRNPTFAPASGQAAFTLSGLSVSINGVDQSQFFTTYKTLGSLGTGVNIPAGTGGTAAVALAAGFGAAPISFDGVNATTTVGLIIKNAIVAGVVPPAGTPTPTPAPAAVTFTQLTAAGGIFTTSCVGCHGAVGAAAGLNLTNYTQARAAATQIGARVISAAAPMPTAGLLPAAQQATITSWVNGGAPQ